MKCMEVVCMRFVNRHDTQMAMIDGKKTTPHLIIFFSLCSCLRPGSLEETKRNGGHAESKVHRRLLRKRR